MRVLIDGDGCPVVDIAVKLCQTYRTECVILCDTAHEIHRDGILTLTFDKGADSVDFAIANRILPGDLVITQDYGLASMCLARDACAIHQDGWEYNQWNIDALLFQRHESKKYRASGGRIKGPAKRTAQQDKTFQAALESILKTESRDTLREVHG